MPVGSKGGLVLFGSAIVVFCCIISGPYINKFVLCKRIKNKIKYNQEVLEKQMQKNSHEITDPNLWSCLHGLDAMVMGI